MIVEASTTKKARLGEKINERPEGIVVRECKEVISGCTIRTISKYSLRGWKTCNNYGKLSEKDNMGREILLEKMLICGKLSYIFGWDNIGVEKQRTLSQKTADILKKTNVFCRKNWWFEVAFNQMAIYC